MIKFTQDDHCKKVLLSTHGSDLAEASSRDSFWGIGSDGKGQNHLGKILSQVRRELIVEQEIRAAMEYLESTEFDLIEGDLDFTEDLFANGSLLKKRPKYITTAANVKRAKLE